MPGANATIYVEMQFRQGQMIAQALAHVRELQQKLSSEGKTPLRIKTTLDFDDKDLQNRLNVKLSALKVAPVIIPLQWGQSPPMPSSAQGLPNWNTSLASGMQSGRWGGGAYNTGFMRNPFSPYGLARMLGGGSALAPVFGGFAALNMLSSQIETMQQIAKAGNNQGEIAQALLSGMDRTAGAVPFIGEMAKNLFLGSSQFKVQNVVDEARLSEQTSQTRFASRMETDRMTEQAQIDQMPAGDARRQREIEFQQKQGQNANRDNAKSQSTAIESQYGRERGDIQGEIDTDKAWWNIHRYLKPEYGGVDDSTIAELRRKQAALRSDENKEKNTVSAEQKERDDDTLRETAAKERDLKYDIRRRQMDSQVAILTSGYSVQAIQQGMNGDTAGALGTHQLMERVSQTGEFEKQKVGLDENSSQFQEVAAKQEAAWKELLAKQAKDTEEFYRDREKMAEDNAAKIESIEADSAVKMRKARNELYGATVDAAKNATDEQAGELDRLAQKMQSVNAPAAAQLRQLAAATRQQGVETQKAIAVQHNREVDLSVQQSENELAVAGLEAGGMNRRARDQALTNEFNQAVDKLDPSDPRFADQRSNLSRRYASQDILNKHRDFISDRHIQIETADADAQARGQHGVGSVLTMEAELQDMARDAAGDPKRMAAVVQLAQRKVAAMQRDMRPQAHIMDISNYQDSLQQSILNGARSDEALKRLGQVVGNVKDAGDKANADLQKQVMQDFGHAVQQWVDVLKNAGKILFAQSS